MNRFLVLSALLVSCSVRAGNPEPPPGRFDGVGGRVTTVAAGDEVPVIGARIAIDGHTVFSDEQGMWRIEAVTATTERVAVQISHPGFASIVRAYAGRNLPGAFLSERMLPVAAQKRIRVRDGGSIVVPGEQGNRNDAALRLPPNFAKFDTDSVDVSISLIRPKKEEELRAFPGDFYGKSDWLEHGEDAIRTFGTVEVSFSVDGKPLSDVKLSSPADLLLRLDPQLATGFPEGSTIPTWTLESTTGVWQGESIAKVVVQNDEKYAAFQATHFSWWNIDQALSTHACVALRLNPASDSAQQMLNDISFAISGVDYAGVSYTDDLLDGVAVVTGWNGHRVRPVFGSKAGQLSPALTSQLVQTVFSGAESFSLPLTSASTYYGQGPGRTPLVPEKHCLYIERPFDVLLGAVNGKVLDDFGDPLPGALVAISELGRTVIADENGAFEFANVPWMPSGGFQVTVAAVAPLKKPGMVFRTVAIVRNQENSSVTMVAEPVAQPPTLTNVTLTDSAPPSGGSTSFELTVDDDNASMQWGFELCGGYETAKSDVGALPAGKVVICHLPPGNLENALTVSVASAAVEAHLAHGDKLGPCAGVDTDSPPRGSAGANSTVDTACKGTVTDLRLSSTAVDPHRNRFTVKGKWNAGLGQGKQILTVLAKDSLGYVIARQAEIVVRNNAPVVFVDAPSYPHADEQVVLNARATDPDGDALTFGWKLNDVVQASIGTTLTLNNLAEGPNYVLLSVNDGKAVVTQRITFYVIAANIPVDGSPPDTSFLTTPPYSTAASRTTFTFSSADTDAVRFECKLDLGAFAPCASPHEEYLFTAGTHTLAVRAVDSADNVDPTPAFATWQMVVDERMVFVANLDAPPVGATETERRALLAAIITEQFLQGQGTPNHIRYRNFIDIQMKRLMDENAATPIDFNPFTYQYRPVTSSVGPYTGPMRAIGNAGYEPSPAMPAYPCSDIPLVGATCLNFYFADIDDSPSQDFMEYGSGSFIDLGIRTVDAATATYRVDVTIPVSIDVMFEPPTRPTLYDRPASESAYENDLSNFPKVIGRMTLEPLRFTYRVTMPTEAESSSTTLTFYPIHIGFDVFTDEFGSGASFSMIMDEFWRGPFCNNNLGTTSTPYAGLSYEADPELRPFGLDGIANYASLISDSGASNYTRDIGPYPHTLASSGGGSGAGRDRLSAKSSVPYAFGLSDNPNNCVRPADACTSSSFPEQDGGIEYPVVSGSCEWPNVSNNSDDSSYKISQEWIAILPYLHGEMVMSFGYEWGFYEWDY